ncbi:hypothetical protein ABTE95_19670, partial [Acinetobacter baumannii]
AMANETDFLYEHALKTGPVEQRVLTIHSEKSLGVLSLCVLDPEHDHSSGDQFKEWSKQLGPLAGKKTVTVPKGWLLGIEPNKRLFDDPKLF